MRIGIFINTPAQAHFYKNIISELENQGHEICVIVRGNKTTRLLVQELQIEHHVYGNVPKSFFKKILHLPKHIMKSRKILKEFDSDLITGFGLYDSITAKLLRKPSFIFNDTEPKISKLYGFYFKFSVFLSNAVITPTSFTENLGKKHLRINSFKEIAYLHPRLFFPKKDILNSLNIKEKDKYVLIRLNSFEAIHDVGKSGFTLENVKKLISKLEKYAKIFIVSEREIPGEFKRYIPELKMSQIHDLIYYASLVVTDTQTIATESAILGTPSIRKNSFVGKNDHGNFIELEEKYNIIFNYKNSEEAIQKAIELMQMENLKEEWLRKKEHLLQSKEDIAQIMVDIITNFPQSLWKEAYFES